MRNWMFLFFSCKVRLNVVFPEPAIPTSSMIENCTIDYFRSKDCLPLPACVKANNASVRLRGPVFVSLDDSAIEFFAMTREQEVISESDITPGYDYVKTRQQPNKVNN